MDFHIEIDRDCIDARVTHIVPGRERPLQSGIWGNGREPIHPPPAAPGHGVPDRNGAALEGNRNR